MVGCPHFNYLKIEREREREREREDVIKMLADYYLKVEPYCDH